MARRLSRPLVPPVLGQPSPRLLGSPWPEPVFPILSERSGAVVTQLRVISASGADSEQAQVNRSLESLRA